MKFFKWLRIFLYLGLVSLAIIKLLPHFADFSKLIQLKNNLRVVWLIAALFTQIGQYLGDGWLSQILLKMINFKMRLVDTIRVASLNVFAAHLLPVGQAGTLLATFYFYRQLGVDSGGIIFLSLAWGIFTNLILLSLFLGSFLFFPQIILPIHSSSVFLILVVLIPLMVIVGWLSRKTLILKIKKLSQKLTWIKQVFKFIKNWPAYKQKAFSSPLAIFQALAAATIYYLSNIATLAFSFLAFGKLPPLSLLAFAYTLSLVAGWATLSPAGIGATEATLVLIFLKAGSNPAITLAAVLVFRLITFWLPIPAGFFSYLSLKKSKAFRYN